jgi:hypothetical protein
LVYPKVNIDTIRPLNGLTEKQKSATRGWITLKTEGDGTCLIHALLQSISPTYRRIPETSRSAIGKKIRTEIFANEFNDADETAQKALVSNPSRWLEEFHINRFALAYKINICAMLETSGQHIPSTYKLSYFPQTFDHRSDQQVRQNFGNQNIVELPNYNTVFLYCRNNIHFETIRLPFEPFFNLSWAKFIEKFPNLYAEIRNEKINVLPLWREINNILSAFNVSDLNRNILRTNFIEGHNYDIFSTSVDELLRELPLEDRESIKRAFSKKEELIASFNVAANLAQSYTT